ncbi:hypothetical protein D3C72_1817540 [compost metagenome]
MRQRVNARDNARQEFGIETLGGGEVHGEARDVEVELLCIGFAAGGGGVSSTAVKVQPQ